MSFEPNHNYNPDFMQLMHAKMTDKYMEEKYPEDCFINLSLPEVYYDHNSGNDSVLYVPNNIETYRDGLDLAADIAEVLNCHDIYAGEYRIVTGTCSKCSHEVAYVPGISGVPYYCCFCRRHLITEPKKKY